MSWSFDVSAGSPPLSCRHSSLQLIHRIDCSAARTVPHPPQGGRSTRGRPLAQPKTPAGLSPSGSASFLLVPVRPGRTGRCKLPRKFKFRWHLSAPRSAVFAREFDLSAAPALAGDFSGRPGSDGNRRTPAHPRQPDLTTMPRHTGAPGALSGPARDLAVQSLHPCPHVARGRPFSADPEAGILRLSPNLRAGPASPQRLVVYPRAERKQVCHGPKGRGQIHVTFVVFARKSGLFFPVFRGLRRAEMILTPRAVRLPRPEGRLQRRKPPAAAPAAWLSSAPCAKGAYFHSRMSTKWPATAAAAAMAGDTRWVRPL